MKMLLKICWLSLMLPALANADKLGRLFFTPEQRVQMDYGYARDVRPDNNARELTLNGIVQKDGGQRTIWINGVAQQAGRSDEKKPESLSVPVPGQNKSIRLKVGQRVLLSPSAKPDTPAPNTSTPDTPKQ